MNGEIKAKKRKNIVENVWEKERYYFPLFESIIW